MKTLSAAIFTLLLVPFLLSAGYEKTKLLLKADFRTRESLNRWNGQAAFLPESGVTGQGGVLLKSGQMIDYPLDPAKFQGTLILDGIYRIRNVRTKEEKPYYGAKLMLVIRLNDGKTLWLESNSLIRTGSSGWLRKELVFRMPEADRITGMFFRIGLENADGEYFCDSIRLYESRSIPDPDTHFSRRDPSRQWKGGMFRGFMSGHSLEEKDFRTLHDWNANLLRYQMHLLNRKITTESEYLDWIDSEIRKMDRVLLLCRKYGIRMVIDLHTGPVGSKRNSQASNILTDPESVLRQLKEAWTKLARHYKGNPQIYGYDILNEPLTESYIRNEKKPWWRIAETVARTIRSIDPETPIIIEPDLSDVRELKFIDVPNLIYSVHAYCPIQYTHQIRKDSLVWHYPGYVQGIKYDREALRKDLMPVREFQLKYNVPIFVGEFSTSVWAPGGEKYLEDLIDIFEEFGWDWTYHAFREWAGWSLEHVGTKGFGIKYNPDNPRMKTVLEILKKNKNRNRRLGADSSPASFQRNTKPEENATSPKEKPLSQRRR